MWAVMEAVCHEGVLERLRLLGTAVRAGRLVVGGQWSAGSGCEARSGDWVACLRR